MSEKIRHKKREALASLLVCPKRTNYLATTTGIDFTACPFTFTLKK